MSEGAEPGVTPEPPPASAPSEAGDAKPTEPEGSSTPEVIKAPMQSFRAQFKAFSKFGDTKSDGKHITLSQSDKWMKQAKVIDGKKITTTDTGIYFKRLKQQKLNLEDYQKFLEDLVKSKKMEIEEIKCKLAACGSPGLTSNSSVNRISTPSNRLPSFKPDFPYS